MNNSQRPARFSSDFSTGVVVKVATFVVLIGIDERNKHWCCVLKFEVYALYIGECLTKDMLLRVMAMKVEDY